MKKKNCDDVEIDLRLAIFTASWWKLDGVTLTLRKLVSLLRKRGVTFRIYTTDASRECFEEEEKDAPEICLVDSIDVPFWSSSQGYKMGAPMSERVRKDLERFGPNLIHVSIPDLLGRDAVYYGNKHDISVMATYHSNYFEYMYKVFPFPLNRFIGECCRLYLLNIYTQIETVYVPTSFTKKKLEQGGFQIDGVNTLKIWGRGIDTRVFYPLDPSLRSTFRQVHGISEDAIVILWVGRVVKEKGIDLWLRCVKRLRERFPKVVGIVVGNRMNLSIFKPYSSFVKCMGWIREPEKLRLVYGSSDIMLFPSSVETFGNVTLEAMACGLPVVVDKDCSGHLVEHGWSGFGVKSLDENAYYKAMCALTISRKLRERMGRQGLRKAMTFGQDHCDVMLHNYIVQIQNRKSWGFVHSLLTTIGLTEKVPVKRYSRLRVRRRDSNEMKGEE